MLALAAATKGLKIAISTYNGSLEGKRCDLLHFTNLNTIIL